MLLGFDALSLLTPDLGLIIWTTVVFLIFWLLVGKFAIKPIAKAIKDREQTITDALASAEKAKEDMQQLQSDNEALLKEAREAKGLTQVQVCKKAKISQTFLSQVESGGKNPSPAMLKKICKVYGVPSQIVAYKSIEEKDVRPEMIDVFRKLHPPMLELINEFFKPNSNNKKPTKPYKP